VPVFPVCASGRPLPAALLARPPIHVQPPGGTAACVHAVGGSPPPHVGHRVAVIDGSTVVRVCFLFFFGIHRHAPRPLESRGTGGGGGGWGRGSGGDTRVFSFSLSNAHPAAATATSAPTPAAAAAVAATGGPGRPRAQPPDARDAPPDGVGRGDTPAAPP